MKRTLEKLRRQEPVTIVVLGDSTSVETPWTFGRRNWVGHLAEGLWAHYGDGFIWIVNSSCCGASAQAELNRLDTSVCRFTPDLLVVGLAMQPGGAAEAAVKEYKSDMRRLIRRVTDTCGSEILLRTPSPVVYGYGLDLPQGAVSGEAFGADEARGERSAQAVLEMGAEMGCEVVDHYGLWKKRKLPFAHPGANPQGLCMRMADFIHPGPVGHLALFRDMAPAFDIPKYFPWEEVAADTC